MSKSPARVTIHASTQDHLDIADIRDNIVLLKNGGACVIIQTTAVNFGLLSETEQDSIIYAYAGFLNSLSFPIQILIRSKKMDITSYLELLKVQEQNQINPALKFQIQKYREFVSSIIQENKVLDKGFYIIVPFSPLEIGAKGSTKSFLSSGNSGKKINAATEDYYLEKAKTALNPKQDTTVRLLTRIGLKAKPLTTTELIKLFYEIYNPEEEIGQKMVSTEDYQSPLVEPVLDIPNFPTQKPASHAAPPPPGATLGNRPRTIQPGAKLRQPPHASLAQAGVWAEPKRAPVPPGQVSQSVAQPAAAPSPVSMDQVQSVLNRLQTEVNKMNGGK